MFTNEREGEQLRMGPGNVKSTGMTFHKQMSSGDQDTGLLGKYNSQKCGNVFLFGKFVLDADNMAAKMAALSVLSLKT